jgi:hypothetical protein
MFLSLGTYTHKFEAAFLADSKWFFQEEGLAMALSVEPHLFLLHVENRLNQAQRMVNLYLSETTKEPLLRVIEDLLLRPHIATLISRGCVGLLDGDRREDVRRMYTMAKRVSALKTLKDAWVLYLR